MPEIVLPAQRHHKSSRGTPRLRRPLRTLHGALRLAMSATVLPDCADALLTACRADLLRYFSLGIHARALSLRVEASLNPRPQRSRRSVWIILPRHVSGAGKVDSARVMAGSG